MAALPDSDIREMIEEDDGAEARCHFCNRSYHFDGKELKTFLS